MFQLQADAADPLPQANADAGVSVFCTAHICFNYRQTLLTLLTHCHKLMPMLGSVFSALLTFVSIKFVQSDSDEGCTWYACKLAAEGLEDENAVLVCRSFLKLPERLNFVVSFAFVCAEGDD